MDSWYKLALSGEVFRRSLLYALIVGGILIVINHGDVLLAGDFSRVQWIKVILTPLVPYIVTTFASVQATRSMQSRQDQKTENR